MKRTFQPSQRKRKTNMDSELEWNLRMEETFWREEERKVVTN